MLAVDFSLGNMEAPTSNDDIVIFHPLVAL